MISNSYYTKNENINQNIERKTNKYNKNDLLKACNSNDFSNLSKFIKYGIDINSTTDLGNTPLYISCKNGNIKIVSYLLDRGAFINHQNNKKMTALHIAVLHGFIDIVTLLLKKGASTSLECNNGLIPLNYAFMYRSKNHDLISKLLIESK